MAATYVTDSNDDGHIVGQAADKLGFFGAAPVVQPSGAGQAAAAAQTQDTLTDNGGGTADLTVASQAAPVTLTDSSGYSGTHDDTVAAMAAIVTLTDNTGDSATHDDVVADGVTVGAALVDNGGGGAADGTIGAITGDQSVKDAVTEVATRCNTLRTDLLVQNQNMSDVTQKVIELVAREAVTAQNISDVTQKVLELVTLATTAQNNLKEVTAQLAKIKTDVANVKTLQDSARTTLVNLGLMKGAA